MVHKVFLIFFPPYFVVGVKWIVIFQELKFLDRVLQIFIVFKYLHTI